VSDDRSTPIRPGTSTRTVKNKVGLLLAGLLSLADLSSPFTSPEPRPNEAGPPYAVLVASAVLGAITLTAIVITWRSGYRAAARVVAGSRIVSALLALPAFFVDGVPAHLVALVSVGVITTVLAVVLVLSPQVPRPDRTVVP
jgi:hypothetical protein